MCDQFAHVMETVDVVLAEARGLAASGPHFRIFHRFREPGSFCMPGEEVASVVLVFRSHECELALPLSLRILFDYLARNRRLPQSAAQVVAGIQNDAFSFRHGANAKARGRLTRKFCHSSIKEYVKRLRRALRAAFVNAGLRFDPSAALISERTEGNEVRYRLRATVEWVHVNLTRFD